MIYSSFRPRITNYKQMSALVRYLRNKGIVDRKMAKHISNIGIVDLDMLDEVLRSI